MTKKITRGKREKNFFRSFNTLEIAYQFLVNIVVNLQDDNKLCPTGIL